MIRTSAAYRAELSHGLDQGIRMTWHEGHICRNNRDPGAGTKTPVDQQAAPAEDPEPGFKCHARRYNKVVPVGMGPCPVPHLPGVTAITGAKGPLWIIEGSMAEIIATP